MFSSRGLKSLLFVSLLATVPPAGRASDEEDGPSVRHGRRVMTLDLKSLATGRKLEIGGDDETLIVEQTKQTGGSISLFRLANPPLQTPYYALRGEISYQSVTGESRLELLHHFPGRKKEPTTRAEKDSGPMKKMMGTSRWRTFWLPFDASKYDALPDALELQIVTDSVGIFRLSSLELYEFTDAKSMREVANPKNDGNDERTLSNPKRRLGMAMTLIGITLVVSGIHFWHLRSQRRQAAA